MKSWMLWSVNSLRLWTNILYEASVSSFGVAKRKGNA